MARSPAFKVYRAGDYIASVKHPEDAAMLIAGWTQEGAQIRYQHRLILWDTTFDGDTGESFDQAATIMLKRLEGAS